VLHKEHVDIFVIISGDSDFSPLVSKLRENNKYVIGIGVKSSTSDLLTASCDEFIFYDDLIRKQDKKRRAPAAGKKKKKKKTQAKAGANNNADTSPSDDQGEEKRRQDAFDYVLETVEALFQDRDQSEKVWGSMVKQTLKRRRPGFNESYHGFKSFGDLLEQAEKAGLMKLKHDEKSGGYIIQSFNTDD